MENLVVFRDCNILNNLYRLSYIKLNAFGGTFLFLALVCLKLTSVAAFAIHETDIHSQIIKVDSLNATAIDISWHTERAHLNPRDFNVEIDPSDGQIIGDFEERKASVVGLVPDRIYRIYLSFRTQEIYYAFPNENAKLYRLDVRTNSAPDSRLYIIPDNTRDSYIVYWSPKSNQINFELTVHNLNTSQIERPEQLAKTARLDSLSPSTTYNLTISDGNQSAWTLLTTRPEMPEQLKVQQFGLNGFNLTWASGSGSTKSDKRSYLVRLLNRRKRQAEDFHTTSTSFSVSDLRAGDGFVVQVSTKDGDHLSRPSTATYVVPPLSPTNMQLASHHSTESFSVNWDPPENSTYDGFIGRYRRFGEPNNWHRFKTYGVDLCDAIDKGFLVDLLPGEQYVLQAITTSLGRNSSPPYPELLHTVKPRPIIGLKAQFEETLLKLYWNRPDSNLELIRVRLYHKEEEIFSNHYELDEMCFDKPNKTSKRTCCFDFEKRYVIPGLEYRAVVDTFANGVYTDMVASVTGYTRPASHEQFVVDLDKSNHSRAVCTYGEFQAGAYDGFRFVRTEMNTSNRIEIWKPRTDWNREVVFDDLKPSTLYEFSMQTTSHGHYSIMSIYNMCTYPAPVQNLTEVSSNPTGVTIRWDYNYTRNASDVDYSVHYRGANDTKHSEFVTKREYHIDKLYPGQYTVVRVLARVHRMVSVPRDLTVRADFGRPARILDVTCTPTGERLVLVRWRMAESNGSLGIDEFRVRYRADRLESSPSQERSVHQDSRSCTFVGMRPGRRYYFEVMARLQGNVASNWKGMWLDMLRMDTRLRLAYKAAETPALKNVDTTTATVVLRRVAPNEKSHNNEYNVIVFVGGQFNYIAVQLNNPFRHVISDTIEVTLGVQECRVEAGVLCNGPLTPGIQYSVLVRVRTNGIHFTETRRSNAVRTVASLWCLSDICGFLIMLACVTAASYLCVGLWKMHPLFRERDPNELPALIPEDIRVHYRTPRICVTPFHRRRRAELPLAEMLHPVRGAAMIQDYCYETFHELRHEGSYLAARVGNLPPNWQFNRYYNIVPFDHSRVELEATRSFPREAYINANYVSGECLNREFIATQCPTALTIETFWRMVWQKGVRAIIALVPLDEEENQYWPTGRETFLCGPFKIIQMTSYRIERGIYSVKLLCLQLGFRRKLIWHMHYADWADYKLPKAEEALAELWSHFRELVPSPERGYDGQQSNAPVVVHCRGGISQTGAFIALDRCMQCIEQRAHALDLSQIVQDMRYSRTEMVDELSYEMVLRVVRLIHKIRDHFSQRDNTLTVEFMKPNVPQYAVTVGPPRIYYTTLTDGPEPASIPVRANRDFRALV